MNLSEIKPQFVLVMGGAGSGKNYYISQNFPSFLLIDIDAIKGELGVGPAITAIRPMMEKAFAEKKNVAHPTTGTNLKAQQNKLALAQRNGYSTTVVLVDTPIDQAIAQVRKRYREGGHDVEIDKIVSSNKIARQNYEALKGLADNAIVTGNTTTEAALPYADPAEQAKYQRVWHADRTVDPADYDSSYYNNSNQFMTPAHKKIHDDGYELLGSGVEAVVVRKPGDNSVVKIFGSEKAIRDCASMQYLLLSRKYSNVNPYFPKVTSIQQVKAPAKDNIMFAIYMEHLAESTDGSAVETETMFRTIFTEKYLERFSGRYAKGIGLAHHLASHVSSALEGNVHHSSIKDKHFLNAASLINKIYNRVPQVGIDIHSGNIMIRRTETGPQLVITDPVID